MPARKEIEHGTHLGYRAHARRKIPSCEPCRKAWAAHQLQAARLRGVKPMRKARPKIDPRIDHGTPRGYEQHRRLKSPTCKDCRAAHSENQRQWAAAKTEEVRAAERAARKLAKDKRLRYGRVQVPLDMFVQLWYTADKQTLDAMDTYFGQKRVDEWIKMNEEEQGASNG